jgi:hypothetical protein
MIPDSVGEGEGQVDEGAREEVEGQPVEHPTPYPTPYNLHPTPHTLNPTTDTRSSTGAASQCPRFRLQGYLAHKNQRPPRTLQ